ncbi:oligosaccharide flippase family protein [Desulfoluna spongiiphila]|uniref:Membrane protein involved in the export of O-antigen and teichoic acid n=1 Tax=Desulfoluna spongiiphila TaxID=419481 RepID=A0A1G5IDZ3_9BACT|nr:oligosaccharide flippase family protein [Desulfoluna spongiiphila]SCY73608.1 Membrane protein involved in the export of O-antigen and teichoic acid [Desulfoluna spongiiphila]
MNSSRKSLKEDNSSLYEIDGKRHLTSLPLKDSVKSYLITGTVWSLIGKLVTVFSNMMIVALLARILSVNDMATYFLGHSIAVFIALFGRFGIENSLLRFVSEFLTEGANNKAISAIYKGVVLVGIISTLFAVLYISLVGPWVSSYFFGSSSLEKLADYIAFWSVVLSFQFVLNAVFKAFKDIMRSVFFGGGIMAINSFVFLFFIINFLHLKLTLYQSLIIILISGSVSVIIALFSLQKKISYIRIGGRPDTISYSKIINHSWPLWINSLSLFVLSQSGIWIVGIWFEGMEVAGFGASNRLILMVSMTLVIVNSVVPPLIAQYNILNKKKELEKILRMTATFASLPVIFVMIIFLVFPGEILQIIFGDGYQIAAPILVILTIGQIVNVLVGSCGYVLIMTGHKTVMMCVSVSVAIISVSCGIIVTEKFGAVGAASAVTLAITIQQILMLIIVRIRVGVWTCVDFKSVVDVLRLKQIR